MQHPLIPPNSSRVPVALGDTKLESIFPKKLPVRSLQQILMTQPVVATQATVLHYRASVLSSSRILLKRNLTYSLKHRRFRHGYVDCSPEERKQGQAGRLLDVIHQLWRSKSINQAKNISLETGKNSPVAFFPTRIDLFSPLAKVTSQKNQKISIRCAVLRGEYPVSTSSDRAIIKATPKLVGSLDENGSVTFADQAFSFPRWGPGDRFVVKIEGLNRFIDNPHAVCRWSVGASKETFCVSRPGQFRLLGLFQWTGPVPEEAKTVIQYVFVYPAGTSVQVREMAALAWTGGAVGTACILCSIACDSLVSLLRHWEGCHPGVGFEYDPDKTRLYFWFSPEKTLQWKTVPGFVDNNVFANLQRDGIGKCSLKRKHYLLPRCHLDGILVLRWFSRRYDPDREEDELPAFSVERVRDSYGVPVECGKQKFVHMHGVRACRPDLKNLCDRDSDEEDEHVQMERERRIHDILDCSQTEKRFMIMWNRFLGSGCILPNQMKATLHHFVRVRAADIEMMDCYPVLVAHCTVLQRDGVITSPELRQLLKYYRHLVRSGFG